VVDSATTIDKERERLSADNEVDLSRCVGGSFASEICLPDAGGPTCLTQMIMFYEMMDT
jgi:hypothetical protein